VQKIEIAPVYPLDNGGHEIKGTLLDFFVKVDGRYIRRKDIATNDGLSEDDFKAWFEGYDLSKPKAVIQFTNFRY
jgi:hypothetical protein